MMNLGLQTQMHQKEILLRRLSVDKKEHQCQIIVGVGKKKYPQKQFRVHATHKNIKTPDMSATHANSPHIK
jgi:hypothetical protein